MMATRLDEELKRIPKDFIKILTVTVRHPVYKSQLAATPFHSSSTPRLWVFTWNNLHTNMATKNETTSLKTPSKTKRRIESCSMEDELELMLADEIERNELLNFKLDECQLEIKNLQQQLNASMRTTVNSGTTKVITTSVTPTSLEALFFASTICGVDLCLSEGGVISTAVVVVAMAVCASLLGQEKQQSLWAGPTKAKGLTSCLLAAEAESHANVCKLYYHVNIIYMISCVVDKVHKHVRYISDSWTNVN